MGLWKECSTLVVKDKTPKVDLARPLAFIWLWQGCKVEDLFKSAPGAAATSAPARSIISQEELKFHQYSQVKDLLSDWMTCY